MNEKNLSIRCYYPNGNATNHRMRIPLTQIKKWVEAYFFTHEQCEAITIKVWRIDDDK